MIWDGCVQTLRDIMTHEYADLYFNEPVDAEALGIPEYYKEIKVFGRGCGSLRVRVCVCVCVWVCVCVCFEGEKMV
jgi:hypothetical protein